MPERLAETAKTWQIAPHDTHPDLLRAEQRIGRRALLELEKRGHLVKMWPDWAWKAGGVCVIVIQRRQKNTGGRC